MDRSAERALLVAALRAFLNAETPAEGLVLNARPLDWDWILRRVEAERIAPLLYVVLRPLPLPVPILDCLRTSWVAWRRQHLLGVEQLRGVLSAFEREGVPVIPLKGPALGEVLYRDPGLRPFTDLDVLIRFADLPRALGLLAALGYRHLEGGRPLEYEARYGAAACFVKSEVPPGLPLDVHWRLLDFRSGSRAATMDPGEVWERAVKVDGWSPSALTLCAEDLLIYLAVHLAVHHALSGLCWRLDLALLIRRHGETLDWESVGERARRWGAAGALYVALSQIHAEFAVGPPAGFLAGLWPGRLRPRMIDWMRRRGAERQEQLDYLVPLLLMDRGSDLLRVLAASTVPSAAWARIRYGHASALRAYLAHYGRIGRVCLRTVRAALFWGQA